MNELCTIPETPKCNLSFDVHAATTPYTKLTHLYTEPRLLPPNLEQEVPTLGGVAATLHLPYAKAEFTPLSTSLSQQLPNIVKGFYT